MKTSISRVLVMFSLIASLGPLQVMAQAPSQFKVPFGFTVGNKSLPAGEYRVSHLTPHVIQVQSTDGQTSAAVGVNADEPGKRDGQAVMTFHQYGDRYFLYKVADPDHGWALPKSPGEKELLASRRMPKPLAVIASSGK